MKKASVFSVIVLVAALCLCSCSKAPEEKLAGKWKTELSLLGIVTELTVDIKEDGTGTINTPIKVGVGLTYSVDGDKIDVSTELLGLKTQRSYSYSLAKDTLTLTETETGEIIVLTRAE